ncbi:pentatricopeptide repeat-containing protein At5g08510-like [Chenopodium quinoa]|nr:pentatricopeptide repeat-containing protein At5g08510-like [Chenopodium quinoa]
MNQVKQIHAFSLRNGFDYAQILIKKLLKIPNISYAHQLFDYIPQPTTIQFNKLIQAYASHGPQQQCFSLYSQMYQRHCSPNPQTFTFLFAACASLCSPHLGRMIHTHFILSGFKFDVFATTALVDMYAKLGLLEYARNQFDHMQYKDAPTWNSLISGYARCGKMEEAEKLFQLIPLKNVISWTTMISGYSQNGQYLDALNTFLSMVKEEGLEPNEVSVTSVLPACANLGALEIGERIEKYARRNGYLDNLFVCNALLELYSKCGKLDRAMQLFNEIRDRKNLCSWNSMMMCFAIHGRHEEALHLFRLMLREGMVPDSITFVAALMACTHGGKVAKGQELFASMKDKFGIIPRLEHYGCMVDLLGRKGKLNEAYNLIQTMPMKPDSVIWGTLLGACSFHCNVEVAEKAAEALFELEPWNSGNYVILSNIYASVKRWDGVAKLRKMMKGSQIIKAAGYSSIEEADQIHMFIVEDKSHPKSYEIYTVLENVYHEIMKSGDDIELDA